MNRSVFRKTFVIFLVFVFVSTGVMAADMEFTILHTNDTHGRVEEGKYDGMGFAKVSTIVKDYRDRKDNILLLDAGDTFHGQTIVNLVEGESIVKIMNRMGYDALTVGNHDFNYGQARLKELNEMTDFPLLGTNLEPKIVDSYLIKSFKGFKIGIFGLATPETTYKTHPKNVEGLTFKDPVETSRKAVAELKEKTDMIIALSHLGMSEGSEYTSTKVAEKVTGIDLIVDGHSHHILKEGKMVNGTLIVQAGEYDKNVGVVDIKVTDNKVSSMKANLITKKDAADIESDQEVLNLIAEIKEKNDMITSKVIGRTSVVLNGERSQVRTGETNLGNLIADAIVYAVDADLAITNGGGIRASINKGDITRGEVITVLPFGNTVVVKKVKGKAILDAVEHGLSQYPAHEGVFPQIGGMSFVFAEDRPVGERVLELKVDGKPIDYDKVYKVATNDFMAAGGDGYEMFKGTATHQEAGGLEEILTSYIDQKDAVAPTEDGRIISVKIKDGNYKYQVEKGDTLREIADIFAIDLTEIVKINNIKDPNMIYEGQKLIVPVK